MIQEKNYAETEQSALEEERAEKSWQMSYGKVKDRYIQVMNLLLLDHTKESRMRLMDLFSDPSFLSNYREENDIATMYIIMIIYQKEAEAGVSRTILDQGDTVESLLNYIFHFKMILYWLDFGVEQEAEEDLLLFLKQHEVSNICIGIMMDTSVIRQLPVAFKLKRIFKQHSLESYLFFMLRYIENLLESMEAPEKELYLKKLKEE